MKSSSDGLTLEALRALAKCSKPHLAFSLVSYRPGYALRYDLNRDYRIPASGFLVAERSKNIRIFKTAEAAFKVLSELGLNEITVELTPVSYSSVHDRYPLDTKNLKSDNIDTVKALNGVST